MAGTIYDYVSTVTPDNNETMSLNAVGVIREVTTKNQVIHLGVDGSEERIEIASGVIAYIDYPFNVMTAEDGNTLFDFWHTSTKGSGKIKSFKLAYTDGHTYVVRFDSDMNRSRPVGYHQSSSVSFKVLGRVLDA